MPRCRTFPAFALLLAALGCGQSNSTAPTSSGPLASDPRKLKAGDPAPPLTIAKFLTGTPFAAFEPGKVYVVDFWAIWCGPCITSMPHLAELQAEYKSRGLVVVAVTSNDPARNPIEKVESFIAKTGKNYGLTYAWCETSRTEMDYLLAAGINGIPCSFVIDQKGTIAYIGHPQELDDIIPRVLDGTWRGKSDLDEIARIDADMQGISRRVAIDPEDALKQLDAFGQKYPARTKQNAFKLLRIQILIHLRRFDEAKSATEPLLAKAKERGPAQLLGDLAAIWSDETGNPLHKHIDLALAALEELLVREGDSNYSIVYLAAMVHSAAQNHDKAIEFAQKAVKLAGANPRYKSAAETLLAKVKLAKK